MAIGIPVASRLSVVYTVAAGMAGAAGALLAQTTGFASLDVFEFHRSADVMLMLVIGGTGWLYGGVAGAIVFKLMQDALSADHAAVLDVLARPVPGGAGAGGPRPAAPALDLVLAQGGTAMSGEVVLSCARPGQALRRHHGHQQRHAGPEARRAPCADRPQRRRQDHADQPADRRAGAHRRPHRAGRPGHHPAGAAPARARAAWCAPSRSTSCSTR